jgi:hypothetical protein
MNAKTDNKNTKNDAISTTFLKLYERFAPEEVKGSKFETLALGGMIFQALIFGGLLAAFLGWELLYMAETFVDPTKHLWGWMKLTGLFLGVPFIAFYLAQRIKNPGSRNHKISKYLLQGLGVLWIIKALINTVF